MKKTLNGTLSTKMLFPSICYEVVVNENDVVVSNIKDIKTFLEQFKNYLIFNGLTNIEQIGKREFRYVYNNKRAVFYKEGELIYG